MLIEHNLDFIKSYKALGIKTNDKVLLCFSSLKIFYLLKNKNYLKDDYFNQLLNNVFQNAIDNLLELIGKNGTILVPTYNWDFCKGKTYDLYKTPSSVGSIGNYVLSRGDFRRTRNPIYSFAVIGKDQNKVCKLSPKSCFGLNSPFEYLIKNKAKNLFVGFDDYREAFHFPYVAEEKAGVDYRYIKTFSAKYKIKDKTYNNFKTMMNVRKIDLNLKTKVDNSLKTILKKNKAYKEKLINTIPFSLVDINKAFHIMVKDIKKEKKLIYPIKI